MKHFVLFLFLLSSISLTARQISSITLGNSRLPVYLYRAYEKGCYFIIKNDGSAEVSAGLEYLATTPSLDEVYNFYGAGSGDIPMYLGGCPVTSISDFAFYGDVYLPSVSIPSSLTSIGGMAFWGCNQLTSVHISDLSAWCKIEFDGEKANPLHTAHNLYLNGSLVTDLKIPQTVTSICSYAFSGCTGLTSVTIPEGVTKIGDYAFSDCSSLTSVTIPSSVTTIGSSAFKGCTNLTSVTIPEGVTVIGSSAFSGCSGLTSVTIPEGVTSIGNSAFWGCSGLTSVIFLGGHVSFSKYYPAFGSIKGYYTSQYAQEWETAIRDGDCGSLTMSPIEVAPLEKMTCNYALSPFGKVAFTFSINDFKDWNSKSHFELYCHNISTGMKYKAKSIIVTTDTRNNVIKVEWDMAKDNILLNGESVKFQVKWVTP